jgi:hypothetical protein
MLGMKSAVMDSGLNPENHGFEHLIQGNTGLTESK